MKKEQYLYRMAEDVSKALMERYIENLRQGKRIPQNLILDEWIRKGIEVEKKERGS